MCLRPHCGQWVRTVYWAPNFVVSSHAGDDFISLFPKLLIPAVILESLLLSNSGPMGITKIALAASSGQHAFGIENRGTILRSIDLVNAAEQRQTICS